MIYLVTALFDRRVDGRLTRSTRDQGHETVGAETPESAARCFLWRLTEAERAATVRLIVHAYDRAYAAMPVYRGPDIHFDRVGRKLVEIATA